MFMLHVESLPKVVAPDSTIIRELLNPSILGSESNVQYSLAHGTILIGEKTTRHRLRSSSEVYFVLAGRARISVNDDEVEVESGSLVYVPPKAMQYVENIGDSDLQYLVICNPPWTPQDVELYGAEHTSSGSIPP